MREFELNVRDEISHLVEFAHGQLAICRDLENMNNEILMELVDKIVNKSLTPEQFELIGGVSSMPPSVYNTLRIKEWRSFRRPRLGLEAKFYGLSLGPRDLWLPWPSKVQVLASSCIDKIIN